MTCKVPIKVKFFPRPSIAAGKFQFMCEKRKLSGSEKLTANKTHFPLSSRLPSALFTPLYTGDDDEICRVMQLFVERMTCESKLG